MIHDAVRKGVLALELCPVYCGSAYKNRGVQPLLDAGLLCESSGDTEGYLLSQDPSQKISPSPLLSQSQSK